MSDHRPFENRSGRSLDEIAEMFNEHPWRMALDTNTMTPVGMLVLQSFAESFEEALTCSDIIIKAIFRGPGINAG